MIKAANCAPCIEAQSVLLEWRDGELRICDGDAGALSGAPFPRCDLELLGFVLERRRQGAVVTILCKHLVPAAGDGQDGLAQKKWRVVRRTRLGREGVYKFGARGGALVPPEVLSGSYRSIGHNGHTVYARVAQHLGLRP